MSTSRVSALSLYTLHPRTGQLATLETTSPGWRHWRPPLRSRRDNRNYCSQFLCCLSQLGYKLVTILWKDDPGSRPLMVIMRSSSVRRRGGKTMEAGSGDNRYPPPGSSSSRLTRHETIRWSQGSPGFIYCSHQRLSLLRYIRQAALLIISSETNKQCCIVED